MSIKVIATNKRAFFDYEKIQLFEAGIVLTGTEIKAARQGQVNIAGAYAMWKSDEITLESMHISNYNPASFRNHDPIRSRKLLLHKKEIEIIHSLTMEKGLTVVPTKVYLKERLLKVELMVGRGRKRYDKRQVIIQKQQRREIERGLRRSGKIRG